MARILIVGTGALANLFGARLAEIEEKITLLGTWKEGVEAVQRNGIQLVTPEGVRTYAVDAAFEGEKLTDIKLALVLVKSWQTERAAKQLSHVLSRDGVALTLQNGLGNKEILSAELGDSRVVQGVTTTGATLLGPGEVRPGGEGMISIEDHPRVSPLVEILERAAFSVELFSDLNSILWTKLMVNAAINPLTALLGVPNGRLLESSFSRQLMNGAALETRQVARSLGISPGVDDPGELVVHVAQKTAENRSSMLQDITRGAPTEIEAISGEIFRRGRAADVPTPINEVLYQLIRTKVDLKD